MSELDQLYAYHPVTGKLHSASPDYPWFAESMRRQGYRVERVTAAEVRSRHERRTAPAPAPALALPALGDRIIHPVAGESEVTHVLTYPDGQQVPVCVGPRGSGMVKAGEWERAPTAAPEPIPEPEPVPVPPPPAPEPAYYPLF